MDGKQLRNSILQWAIQGKLVPQDPNDEPASVLLERIREEKARLVKEKKIKRDKNESIIYRGDDNSYYEKFADGNVVCIDEEIPFYVPETWSWCRLRSVIRGTGAGKSPNCDKRPKNDDEWGVLTTTAIQYCDFLPNENKVLPANYTINADQKVELEDLLITRAGPRNRTGIVCVANKVCDKLILSDKTVRIEYIRNYCNPYYLMFVLNSPAIHDSIMAATVGMADSQVNISQNNIQNIVVPIPPHNEQQRIVNKLDVIIPLLKKYSSAKGKQDKLNNNIHLLIKKSILQEAIQGRLVPQDPKEERTCVLLQRIKEEKQRLVTEGKLKKKDIIDSTIIRGDDNKYYEKIGKSCFDISDEIPFEIPSSWLWTRIGIVFNHCTGKALNSSNNNGTPMEYITTSNLYWNKFELKDLRTMFFTSEELEKCTVTKGDLLVCEGGDIGRAAIWNYDYEIRIQNHIHKLRPYVPVCTKYFYYVFYLYKHTGLIGGKGIGIQGLSSSALHKLIIPIPPIEEQTRIVKRVDQLFQLSD